jgi:2-polyprenyl-6-methoxyphenol hydroxylase-like FAD-dependent oxidoreductase
LEPQNQKYNRAIVIGASMAGLPTAQVLTRYFKKVLVIDRDTFAGSPEPRMGVPQGRHPHLFLKKGQLILEEIFPGLTQDLIRSGAVEYNWGSEFAHHVVNWRPLYTSSIINLACSRGLLEHAIRNRLKHNTQVEWLDNCEVVGLDLAGGKLKGVRVQKRGENGSIFSLPGDFVVDCSGRTTHTSHWLETVGYPAPRKEVVNAQVGYASRIYRHLPGVGVEWKTFVINSEPAFSSRGVYIIPQESGHWLVTLQGFNADYPPTSEQEFEDYIHSIPVSELSPIIEKAVPISPITGYRNTQNCMFHFEELPRYLENYVVLGDAVCTTNPAYGMGMSTAQIGVQELDKCLKAASGLDGLSEVFHKQVYQSLRSIWNRATNLDRRWSKCEGPVVNNAPNAALVDNYMTQAFKASFTNFIVLEAFNQIVNLVAEDSILFRSDIVLEVVAEMSGLTKPVEVIQVTS